MSYINYILRTDSEGGSKICFKDCHRPIYQMEHNYYLIVYCGLGQPMDRTYIRTGCLDPGAAPSIREWTQMYRGHGTVKIVTRYEHLQHSNTPHRSNLKFDYDSLYKRRGRLLTSLPRSRIRILPIRMDYDPDPEPAAVVPVAVVVPAAATGKKKKKKSRKRSSTSGDEGTQSDDGKQAVKKKKSRRRSGSSSDEGMQSAKKKSKVRPFIRFSRHFLIIPRAIKAGTLQLHKMWLQLLYCLLQIRFQ